MSPRRSVSGLRLPVLGAVVLLAGGVAGCGGSERDVNLVAGKQQFIEKCGACHILSRAETKGIVGPNLDQAFDNAVDSGFTRDTVDGVVEQQILYPRKGSEMPAKLATGQDAKNIAAYVAEAAAAPGPDTGELAQVTPSSNQTQSGPAVAENGKVEIPADPDGQLAYQFTEAEAKPGKLEIDSPNEASVEHNIAIQSGGVNAVGPTVKGGDVSSISVTVKPGTYEYLCTVPGHAQAGMKGTLTVK
jgi:uncharacterized cupredoxin-like copper-binding protein